MINKQTLWSAAEAAVITGGKSATDWQATGLCLKLEDIQPGDLFFASKTDDLDLAFQRGAAASVVRKGSAGDSSWPVLEVGDVYQALQDLARASRYRTHASVISAQGNVRDLLVKALSTAGGVHESGRHVSVGMASMPMNAMFSVFGFSPAVQPDIAVISDGKAALNSAIFETMPAGGMVVLNADDEEFIDVLAQAKAAGIEHVFTYGQSQMADARVESVVQAMNGVQVTCRVLGQIASFVLPPGSALPVEVLAAFCALKLMGHSVQRYAYQMALAVCEEGESARRVHLMHTEAYPKSGLFSQTIFRVMNMIDLGFNRRTAVLDNLRGRIKDSQPISTKVLDAPKKLGTLDLVYACKKVSVCSDAHGALKQVKHSSQTEEIVPDVLMPGDFVVFKDVAKNARTIFSEALRIVPKAA